MPTSRKTVSARRPAAGLRSLALLLAFLSPAFAMQAMPPGPPEDGPRSADHEARMLKRMQKHLDLTAEQTQKIQAIHDKYRSKSEALHKQVQPLRKQLHEALTSGSAKRSDVEQLMRKMADLRIEMQLLHFDRHTEVNAVLTPAQQKKMKERMQKHMQKMEKMQKKHGSHGDDAAGPHHPPEDDEDN